MNKAVEVDEPMSQADQQKSRLLLAPEDQVEGTQKQTRDESKHHIGRAMRV